MSLQSPAYVAVSPRRVAAMVLRHWYLLRSSWPRLFDLMYWPAVQMLMWGFLQMYVAENSSFFVRAAGSFVGAVMLWDTLFRGQLGFSISFLEEMYSRNIGNLMMSPLRPIEFITALMIMSVIRLAIGMIPVSLLAIWFFGFNLWGLGIALAVTVESFRPLCDMREILPDRGRQDAGRGVVNLTTAHVDQLRRLRGTDECPEFDGRDREARQMHSPLHDRGDCAWALSLLELASLKHGATAAGPVAHEYRNAGPHSMQVVQRSPDNSTLVTFAPLR